MGWIRLRNRPKIQRIVSLVSAQGNSRYCVDSKKQKPLSKIYAYWPQRYATYFTIKVYRQSSASLPSKDPPTSTRHQVFPFLNTIAYTSFNATSTHALFPWRCSSTINLVGHDTSPSGRHAHGQPLPLRLLSIHRSLDRLGHTLLSRADVSASATWSSTSS